jgi:hypothetical protein
MDPRRVGYVPRAWMSATTRRSPRIVPTVPVVQTGVVHQYQEELPVTRVVVRQCDVHVGRCDRCGHCVQGRHPLQTSDAVGAAAAQLGPQVIALVVVLNKQLGLSFGKIVTLFQQRYGLTVTRSGLCMPYSATRGRPDRVVSKNPINRKLPLFRGKGLDSDPADRVADDVQPLVADRHAWLSHPLQFVLVALAGWINQQQRDVIDYLQEENRVLREQLGARRLRFTDDQRRRLAAKARTVGRRVLREFASIVTPDTLLAWHRALIATKYDRQHASPSGTAADHARDPRPDRAHGDRKPHSWGYTRVQGALATLDHRSLAGRSPMSSANTASSLRQSG